MQSNPQSISQLSPIGYDDNRCGYCGNSKGSFSYYAQSALMTSEFYQKLLDRGWRRSGTLLYKPDLRNSCCPQYTVRLDSHGFRANKDQRQTLNRFNKYVLGDPYMQKAARLYPKSREQAKKLNTDFDLVQRTHESEKVHVATPPEPAHNFTVTLESNTFTEEKYAVYENYQKLVHHEPPHKISRRGFQSFLCSSPLTNSVMEDLDGSTRLLGSYHQCYRVDGKLVAIGVLDLLPQCVSAVYFMYDESVYQHVFGKIGAMREIALAKEEGYRWWYAGFYIHNCAKMKYKGDYSPQYILDPESYTWDLFDSELKRLLDQKKYVSMSAQRIAARNGSHVQLDSDAAVPIEPEDDTDHDKDADSDVPVPDSEVPVYARSMPGVMTETQLLTDVDLDNVRIKVGETETVTSNLISWESAGMESTTSIKGIIGELVATIGAELVGDVIVKFG